jgi:hypothetical protein
VTGGQKMTVNPPGDVHEQEADSIAQQVAQRQVPAEPEEEEEQEEPAELAMKPVQRQPAQELEEPE